VSLAPGNEMLTHANDLTTWAEKHARGLFQLTVVALLLFALWLRLLHFTDVPSRSPDERVYSHFAQQIALEGIGAYRSIFASYAADPGQWIYPSPTRVVHVLLFAGVMKLTGSTSPQAGAAVSLALGVASVLLLAWLGRRFFNRFVGVLAAFFLASYVAELEFARRAWGESTASFLCVLLLYSTCALAHEPLRWRSRLLFFATGLACLLTKETTILAYGLCGAWLLTGRLLARDRASAALLGGGAMLSGLIALGALSWLACDVTYAIDGVLRGVSIGSNDWGALNASGPWYQFPRLLALIGPVTVAMAGVGAVVTFVPRSAHVLQGLGPGAPRFAGLALLLAVAFIAACSFGPDLQYLRMMAPAHAPYCLLAALGVRSVLTESEGWVHGRGYPVALALLPLVLAFASQHDYSLYRDVIVRSGMQDMAARWILDGAERLDKPLIEHARNALEEIPKSPPAEMPASASDASATSPAAAGGHLNRSLELCQKRQFVECVNAARAAIQGNPTLPEAWNNAAVGYAGLGLWDDAVTCADRAVTLRPDFQLAKNNLAWASQERAMHAPLGR
jgi:tetratricopeptide (TPR) repeat protein